MSSQNNNEQPGLISGHAEYVKGAAQVRSVLRLHIVCAIH